MTASPSRSTGRGTRRRTFLVLLVLIFTMSAGPATWIAWRAGDDMAAAIETDREQLALLAATQADRIVVEAFHEVELIAQVATEQNPSNSAGGSDVDFDLPLGPGAFHTGIAILDEHGVVARAEPASLFVNDPVSSALAAAHASDTREVSMPWFDEDRGHAMVALSIPVFVGDGDRMATVVGVLDLADPIITDLILPATRLGPSGHADLVDDRGDVLASTQAEHVMSSGDHPDFYSRASTQRLPMVDRVIHVPDQDLHLMAYAPLSSAPWGITIGSSLDEALAPVDRMRSRLLAAGAAMVATLAVGMWWALERLAHEIGPTGDENDE